MAAIIEKPHDHSFPIGKGMIYWQGRSEAQHWDNGEFKGPLGIVSVTREWTVPAFTNFQFCKNGRLHIRSFDRCYSQRTCVYLARQFAEDMTKKRGK